MIFQGVGKVVENGPGASKFPIGTRVVAAPWNTHPGDGSWQQYTVVPESVLVCDTCLSVHSSLIQTPHSLDTERKAKHLTTGTKASN